MTLVRPVQGSMFTDHSPDRPVGPILASVQTGTNADLIAAVAPYYLTGSVLDVTYGDGKWWDRYRPASLVCHDLDPAKGDGVDFRDLPHIAGEFDAVCFDPPYVISGGTSKQMPHFQNAYGIGGHNLKMTNSEGGNVALTALMEAGLRECIRVSRKWVLVKCMEFAQGGGVKNAVGRDFHDIPYLMTKWAIEAGAYKHDQIVHFAGSGPGGHNIFTPKRARRHHSYLLVFRAPSLFDEVDR